MGDGGAGAVDAHDLSSFPDWAELPSDPLLLVMAALETPDLVRSGAVCSPWHAAYATARRLRIPTAGSAPYLLYACADDDDPDTCTVHSPANGGSSFRVRLPQLRGRTLHGSAHGWLVAEDERAEELAGPLRDLLPPVDFCCAYGSTLLHARPDATSMVDYILGVADPLQWHSENLARNPAHYSRWMARLGAGAITGLADRVGVGVHFNPFVEWRDKRIKYGVVRMRDLAMDVLTWDKFYLSGRLQKPVHVLVDNWDIRKVNSVNLEMATSASLLLLPAEFTEYDLYAQICSISYMGDLRMLFAEDKDKVKKIVEGSFQSFQLMYRPVLQEYIAEGLLETSSHGQQKTFRQDCGLSTTNELFSVLPWTIQRQMQGRFPLHKKEIPTRTIISSKDAAANCVRRALRRRVMASSARQAMSGLLASGSAVAAQYLGKKMAKAWHSRAA